MSEEQSSQKMEKLILEMNKHGLSYLTTGHSTQSLEYFKKAERITEQELKIDPQNHKVNQLAGITYNNLACYYKKNNKPKVALSYLKKALQLQVYKVEDWVSTASTHINICAIYSHLAKHHEAAEHAELAITLLQKVDPKALREVSHEGDKAYWNIKMFSHYNFAVELQHLKKYPQSRKQYELAKQTALSQPKKNETLIQSIDQSIQRVNDEQQDQKKKLIQLLAKRKIQEEKGNHDFMRKNKKNYGDQAEWRSIIEAKKYQLYKTQNNPKRHYQSTGKVRRLAPLGDGGSNSKRGLENNG